jgi:hypothetical protein
MIGEKNKEIFLMTCWPRSGGTLLNKILVNDPNLIVLSELNIKYPSFDDIRHTIRWQLDNWYGLKCPENQSDQEILSSLNKTDNRTILIRGFNFIDFVSSKFNSNLPNKINNNFEILSETFKIKEFSQVRRSKDIYVSMMTSRGLTDLGFEGYDLYINDLIARDIKVFTYEDLCKNPETFMEKLYNFLGINFSQKYLEDLNNSNVLGDISPDNNSRAYNSNKVQYLNEKKYEEKIDEFLLDIFKRIDNKIYKNDN